jgi:hypothetical protein
MLEAHLDEEGRAVWSDLEREWSKPDRPIKQKVRMLCSPVQRHKEEQAGGIWGREGCGLGIHVHQAMVPIA